MIPAQNFGSQPTQFFVTQLKENTRSEARVGEARVGEAGVAALTIDSCIFNCLNDVAAKKVY